jgi:mono/diheme cytochrome c family protein
MWRSLLSSATLSNPTKMLAIVSGFALALSITTLAQSNRTTQATPQENRTNASQEKNDARRVARGKYIVEGIAVCGQCHTPRTSQGDLDRSRWLEGAPLWLQPAAPSNNWPLEAPRIDGAPPGSDSDLVTLLTTGVWRCGQRPRPPMPVFHMSPEDAQAVVAYLRSLSPPYGVR